MYIENQLGLEQEGAYIRMLAAIVMKFYFTTILLLLELIVFGQINTDTTIAKSSLYDLKQTIHELKESNKLQLFQIRLLTELKQIDTIHQSKDSLVIVFKDSAGKPIKKERRRYKLNCVSDSLVVYYNPSGLTEYMENWAFACRYFDGSEKDEVNFGYRNNYYRYEYDSLGRVTKYSFHISTPMTRRVVITYDAAGKPAKKTTVISDNEFWD